MGLAASFGATTCPRCGDVVLWTPCHRCGLDWTRPFPANSGEPLEALSLTEKEGFEPSFPETTVSKRDADIPRWLEVLEQERSTLLGENGPRSRASNVYAIGVPSRYVKIGLADKPAERLRELQVGNPDKLTLLGHIAGPVGWERFIHDALAETRLRGEWFSWSEDVDALLEAFARATLGVIRPRGRLATFVPEWRKA